MQVVMNPQQQQVSATPRDLPPGVQDIFIGYNVYGRPHVMMTFQEKPRRRLMWFAVSLLVFGPLIIALVTACMVLQHFWVAYGYAAGVLVSQWTSRYTLSQSITQSTQTCAGVCRTRVHSLTEFTNH